MVRSQTDAIVSDPEALSFTTTKRLVNSSFKSLSQPLTNCHEIWHSQNPRRHYGKDFYCHQRSQVWSRYLYFFRLSPITCSGTEVANS